MQDSQQQQQQQKSIPLQDEVTLVDFSQMICPACGYKITYTDDFTRLFRCEERYFHEECFHTYWKLETEKLSQRVAVDDRYAPKLADPRGKAVALYGKHILPLSRLPDFHFELLASPGFCRDQKHQERNVFESYVLQYKQLPSIAGDRKLTSILQTIPSSAHESKTLHASMLPLVQQLCTWMLVINVTASNACLAECVQALQRDVVKPINAAFENKADEDFGNSIAAAATFHFAGRVFCDMGLQRTSNAADSGSVDLVFLITPSRSPEILNMLMHTEIKETGECGLTFDELSAAVSPAAIQSITLDSMPDRIDKGSAALTLTSMYDSQRTSLVNRLVRVVKNVVSNDGKRSAADIQSVTAYVEPIVRSIIPRLVHDHTITIVANGRNSVNLDKRVSYFMFCDLDEDGIIKTARARAFRCYTQPDAGSYLPILVSVRDDDKPLLHKLAEMNHIVWFD